MKIPSSLLFFILLSIITYAQDGTQDSTFGEGGFLKFKVGDENVASDLVLLDNNTFITAGYYFMNFSPYHAQLYLSKHFQDGSFDSGYGTDGKLDSLLDSISGIQKIMLLPNGNILTLNTNAVTKLLSLHQNGSWDTTFGNNGTASTPNSFHFDVNSDGKIITAGMYFDGTNGLINLACYNADGSPDFTFGNNGVLHLNLTSERIDYVSEIKIQKDDKILIAGGAYTAGPGLQERAVVSRYNSDGSFDATFGVNGIVVLSVGDAGGFGAFRCIDIQEDGKLVLGGYAEMNFPGNYTAGKAMIVRLNSDGSCDTAFSANGIKVFDYGSIVANTFQSILALPDKNIVAAGHAFASPISVATCIKLDSSGAFVPEFADNGTYFSSFNNFTTSFFTKVKLRNDGNLLLCGSSSGITSSNNKSALVVCLKNTVKKNKSEITEINIYPNPAKGDFIISGVDQYSTIKIYTVLGQEIQYYKTSINENETRIRAQLSSGVYFINVDGQKNKTKRIIVY